MVEKSMEQELDAPDQTVSAVGTVDAYGYSAFSLTHFWIKVIEWITVACLPTQTEAIHINPHRNTKWPVSQMILDFVKLMTLITTPTTTCLENDVSLLIFI